MLCCDRKRKSQAACTEALFTTQWQRLFFSDRADHLKGTATNDTLYNQTEQHFIMLNLLANTCTYALLNNMPYLVLMANAASMSS